MRHRLFVANLRDWDQSYEGWIFAGEDHDYLAREPALTLRDQEDIRNAIVYLFMCAKRIAAYQDGTKNPSAEYLMPCLPDWLHPYFPGDFDWGRVADVAFTVRP